MRRGGSLSQGAKDQAHDETAAGPVEQGDRGTVGIGHGLDDGETQTAAGRQPPGVATGESLEHAALLGIGDARPAIRDVDL